jgi:hypothetical protein
MGLMIAGGCDSPRQIKERSYLRYLPYVTKLANSA